MSFKINIAFNEFYDNCMYWYFAHTAFSLKQPFLAYTLWWDDINYTFNDDSRGAITFDIPNKMFVGAIRDDKSNRRSWYPEYQAINLFEKAPNAIKTLAENEALQYLFDEVNEVTVPVATTAFWNEGDQLVSFEKMEDFLNSGGEFILTISASFQELRENCIEEYELTSEQLELVDFLFKAKKSGNLLLKKQDIPTVSEHDVGYKEFIELLTQVGFEVK